VSPTIAVKELDKSTFLHHGTGIPVEARGFFNVENIRQGDKVDVTLRYQGTSHPANINMTILNRTRLFWKADFSTLLAKQYPELYNAHLKSIKPTGPQPGLCFKKFNYRTYEISFQDAQGNRGIKKTPPLVKYQDYDREEVHDIFAPHSPFTPKSGSWGLRDIVKIPNRDNDFVFFATYGQSQASHAFVDGVTEDGILTWQSKPSQTLNNRTTKKLINHNHLQNNFYLFIRKGLGKKYTYLGRLAYVSHDTEREQPVHFKWQILEWEIPEEMVLEIGLQIELPTEEAVPETLSPGNLLVKIPPPASSQIRGVRSRDFKGCHVDFAENETVNKECGKAGEFLVVEYEKDTLIKCGRRDLADKVIHTSEIEGDGAGYDIQSYTPEGEIKYIEVKTTSGGRGTPFMLSINELAFSKQHPRNYCLYRIYDYSKKVGKGKFYVIHGDLSEHFTLDPVKFKARR